MARYFFHTADGGRAYDRDGVELPDQHAARREAIRFAGAIINHEPELLWDGHDFRVEVTNEHADLLFTILILAVDAPAAESANSDP